MQCIVLWCPSGQGSQMQNGLVHWGTWNCPKVYQIYIFCSLLGFNPLCSICGDVPQWWEFDVGTGQILECIFRQKAVGIKRHIKIQNAESRTRNEVEWASDEKDLSQKISWTGQWASGPVWASHQWWKLGFTQNPRLSKIQRIKMKKFDPKDEI